MSSPADANTVDSLYRDHHSWLIKRLQRKLACSHQAADFAQDTFVRILSCNETNNRVAAIREPRSYLTTIANRVLIDHFRRAAIEKAYLEALALQPESLAISSEQQVLLLESLQELDNMLHGLGTKIRRAFLLSQLYGKPYADIAVELGVSESSVKKYMAKAIASCLQYALEQE